MDSRIYWIWLAQAVPAGDERMNALLDAFGSAAGVYAATEKELCALSLPSSLVKKLTERSLEEARWIFQAVGQRGDWMLTPEDALYPLRLRELSGCPAVLYCRGTMPDLSVSPGFAVVGTRRATPQGAQEAFALSAGLAAGGMTVVSGGAAGIDAAVHRGALAAKRPTVVVMACPLDEHYPQENEDLRCQVVAEGGLLLSEYPPGLPYRCVFPVRNRLLVGLSEGVCLAETPQRSGARITARLAREQGIEVFALPGALTGHHNDGANREIQNGAALVMGAGDILREYVPRFPGLLSPEEGERAEKRAGWMSAAASEAERPEWPKKKREPRRKKKQPETQAEARREEPPTAPAAECPELASETARAVWKALTASPCPVDELAQKTALPVPRLLAALTELEMLGAAENRAGQQYLKKG